MALDFFAGCVGGVAGVIVAHPLDTVKVRIQTQCPTNPKYRGTFHCLTATIKQESISGLYKGIASPLYGVTAINALIFGVYGQLKPLVVGSPGNDALWAHFAAGSVAGATQSIIASPMELVKTRMQLDESSTYSKGRGPSAWDVMRNVYAQGGVRRGIFKGWCVTLSREIPGLGAYFATYEALTRNSAGEVSTGQMLFAGGMAGVASWVSCFPMDVIKTRLQSDVEGKYSGALDCYRKTVAAEGYRALFRGLNSTLIRSFPSNAATFTVVTWVMRLAEQRLAGANDDRQQNNLELLLEQWGSLQENVRETLQWKAPQYAFISAGSAVDLASHSFLENYSTARLPQLRSSNQEAKCVGNAEHVGSEERFSVTTEAEKTSGLYTGHVSTARQERSSRGMRLEDSHFIVEEATLGMLPETFVDTSSSRSRIPQQEKKTSNQSHHVSFSTVGNNGVSKGSKELDSAMQTNSHATGSFPPDLTVLAEILDLPVVVLENSLEGKPITLLNIILTWLRQGTRFGLCKCLDALDHCVCLSC